MRGQNGLASRNHRRLPVLLPVALSGLVRGVHGPFFGARCLCVLRALCCGFVRSCGVKSRSVLRMRGGDLFLVLPHLSLSFDAPSSSPRDVSLREGRGSEKQREGRRERKTETKDEWHKLLLLVLLFLSFPLFFSFGFVMFDDV